MLGVIPIPTSIKGFSNYKKSIEKLISLKHAMTIYPEAHIWPYYTDIRPFGTEGFHYQAELGVPCYTFTKIYKRRILRFIKRPKVTIFIDGPFDPDMSLPKIERIQKLRDDVYAAMKKRVDENFKYDYYNYVHVVRDKPLEDEGKQSVQETAVNEAE